MTKHRQSGVVLIFLVIIIAVLLGIAAFSLDLGRLFVLKTEMQNAVDSAALAGAKELDSQSGAVVRAKAAALGLIRQNSHFATVKEVLSPDLVEGQEVAFRFFCAIENDLVNGADPSSICGNDFSVVDGKIEVPWDHTDADTYVHYVEVVLNPRQITSEVSDRYKIPLFFLPALRAIGVNAPTEAPTSARALAGRQYRPCRYPPIMMCDPSEDSSLPSLDVGDMVQLKAMTGSSSTWAPGNFGFLIPANCIGPDGKNTCVGNALRDGIESQLANEAEMGCQPPYVSTYPGANTDFAVKPINTRFGLGSTSANPAAPNVVDYPRDDNFVADRFGDGVLAVPVYSSIDPPPNTLDQLKNLSEDQYLNYYFVAPPSTLDRPVRYNHYVSEVKAGVLPNNSSSGLEDCKDIGGNVNKLKDCRNVRGEPGAVPQGEISRRVLYVASLNCIAQGVKGNMTNIYVPPPPAGWKKFFLTEHVAPPSSDPDDKVTYFAEYLGPASQTDGNFDVVIQLYE